MFVLGYAATGPAGDPTQLAAVLGGRRTLQEQLLKMRSVVVIKLAATSGDGLSSEGIHATGKVNTC